MVGAWNLKLGDNVGQGPGHGAIIFCVGQMSISYLVVGCIRKISGVQGQRPWSKG